MSALPGRLPSVIDSPQRAGVVKLDRVGSVPLYRQIAADLTSAITVGSLPGGSWLPNEDALAERYQVSKPTAHRAVLQLAGQGLVERPRDGGARVRKQHHDRPLNLTSLLDDLAHGELGPHTVVLTTELAAPPPEVAARLETTPQVPALHLRRLRTANGEPLAILENWLPGRVPLDAAAVGSAGLYQSMRKAGVQIRLAAQQIGARLGTDDECRLLGEPPLSPMMTMQRLTHDDAGRVVEWGNHVYRASRYEFTMTLFSR